MVHWIYWAHPRFTPKIFGIHVTIARELREFIKGKNRWFNNNTIIIIVIIEGSLEVKLPTIWTDENQRWGRGREKRNSQKKEDAGARKGRKVAIHCVFPMICGSGGSKSRLAKAAGAEPAS